MSSLVAYNNKGQFIRDNILPTFVLEHAFWLILLLIVLTSVYTVQPRPTFVVKCFKDKVSLDFTRRVDAILLEIVTLPVTGLFNSYWYCYLSPGTLHMYRMHWSSSGEANTRALRLESLITGAYINSSRDGLWCQHFAGASLFDDAIFPLLFITFHYS